MGRILSPSGLSLSEAPGLSLLHCAHEQGWEQSAELQGQNPTHFSSFSLSFSVTLRGPPAFLFAVHMRRKYATHSNLPPVSTTIRITRPLRPPFLIFPAWPPSATPCLWSMQRERNCVQTIAREGGSPLLPLHFSLSLPLPHRLPPVKELIMA